MHPTETTPLKSYSVPQSEAADHVLMMDRGDATVAVAKGLLARQIPVTISNEIEQASILVRETRPSVLVLGVDKESVAELNLIKEAVMRNARVIVIGPADADFVAQRALAQGATDYVSRPVSFESLWRVLGKALKHPLPTTTSKTGRSHNVDQDATTRLSRPASTSGLMRQVVDKVKKVGPTSATVLITGESGTGKEIVAQAIHEQSRRSDKPFIPVNCGAIAPQLIESELFGHEKGSFTGAVRDHRGLFERADGGTLFLDEITEMPMDLQVKLLRVLETSRFAKVGSGQEQNTDVRIIAAANRDPEQEVEEGRLRADLLYRLRVFPITLPPLRDRSGDVRLLACHFLEELNELEHTTKEFTDEALDALEDYRWPGNLRELKNLVLRAHIMAGEIIDAADLPEEIFQHHAPVSSHGGQLNVRVGTSMAEVERELIFATLSKCDGKKEKAARVLGVSVKTLYNRLRDYEKEGEQAG